MPFLEVCYKMGLIMRKPAFVVCEQKDANQLVHLRSLISSFVVHFLELIILATYKSVIF